MVCPHRTTLTSLDDDDNGDDDDDDNDDDDDDDDYQMCIPNPFSCFVRCFSCRCCSVVLPSLIQVKK